MFGQDKCQGGYVFGKTDAKVKHMPRVVQMPGREMSRLGQMLDIYVQGRAQGRCPNKIDAQQRTDVRVRHMSRNYWVWAGDWR